MSVHDSWVRYSRAGKPDRGAAGTEPLWRLTIPLGWVGSAYARFRNLAYDRGWSAVQSPAVPVVGVGNLTLGGTSKTPCVSWLTRELSRRMGGPDRVGVLIRGYTGSGEAKLFRAGAATRGEVGDEALLLSRQLPESWIAVGRSRVHGAQQLADSGVRLAVADDAFQHRRLARVFDLVLIDAEVPFGNRRVIPAGWLREPVDGLSRADAVLLTRSGQVDSDSLHNLAQEVALYVPPDRIFCADLAVENWIRLAPGTPSRVEEAEPPDPATPGFAFSAIARPGALFDTLTTLGYELQSCRRFRDHHFFSRSEADALGRDARDLGAHWIACTEKDLFNLPPTWEPPLPLYIPCVRLRVEQDEALLSLICSQISTAQKEH